MMRQLFLINGLIELIGGILFFVVPSLIFDRFTHDVLAYNVMRIMYSFAALTIGFLSNLIFVHYAQLRSSMLLFAGIIFAAFHLSIGLVLYLAYRGQMISHMGGTWFHVLLSVLFIAGCIQLYRAEFQKK